MYISMCVAWCGRNLSKLMSCVRGGSGMCKGRGRACARGVSRSVSEGVRGCVRGCAGRKENVEAGRTYSEKTQRPDTRTRRKHRGRGHGHRAPGIVHTPLACSAPASHGTVQRVDVHTSKSVLFKVAIPSHQRFRVFAAFQRCSVAKPGRVALLEASVKLRSQFVEAAAP